jgi:hypothetical protein
MTYNSEYLSAIKDRNCMTKVGLKVCTSAEISCTICEITRRIFLVVTKNGICVPPFFR